MIWESSLNTISPSSIKSKLGGSLTGSMIRTKSALPEFKPSSAVTIILSSPFQLSSGVTVRIQSVPSWLTSAVASPRAYPVWYSLITLTSNSELSAVCSSVITKVWVNIISSSLWILSIFTISGGVLPSDSITVTINTRSACCIPGSPDVELLSVTRIVMVSCSRASPSGYHRNVALCPLGVILVVPDDGGVSILKVNCVSSTSLIGLTRNEYS